jgi:hypothetical protein
MQDIKEHLSYDPLTGEFTWLKPTAHRVKVGDTAGYIHSRGYVHINYKAKPYKAHRLAWVLHYGLLPKYKIDHINEIKHDNRISNLRLDIHRQNKQNVTIPSKSNTSGYTGVSFHKTAGKWAANIYNRDTQIYLGLYDTPEEAHEAYLTAKRELHTFWVENK